MMQCDLCGSSIPVGSEIHSLVADSSAVHGHDPSLDGRRILTACSLKHLADLQHNYRQRPFINAELWATKIALALQQHPDGLSTQRLVAETGLNTLQIEHAIAWQHERRRSEGAPAPLPSDPADTDPDGE
ncbi:hypothetical protein R1T08_14660 [Streptomyces sp. SBC-4]|nr:hypothetical protein [Streptomyces sp. SBC-4]MDV5145419.1 hypothetical protein [Streptomyces sp. SBC-4]